MLTKVKQLFLLEALQVFQLRRQEHAALIIKVDINVQSQMPLTLQTQILGG